MAAQTRAATPSKFLRSSDLVMALAILSIVAMLIVPMPGALLDYCITFNLAGAVMILLVTLYTTEPLQFSVFPSLLLVATLFRLALNIAATKLILATGQPGHVIEAFGNVVLGGNFVVGVIAFSILVVVQFVVITSGASRVAEVAARFTLDAMPGKQMSIDADLQAGLLTDTEARELRQKMQREADYFGAMDGASKFVRGDAMAAVLIILINIVGGFAMGLLNGKSDAMTILKTYTILTVGEGLVSQVPALLISTATGLLVTRAASRGNMGQEFFHQMSRHPRTLIMAGGTILSISIVPGFPKMPLLVIGSAVIGVAVLLQREQKDQAAAEALAERKQATASKSHEDPSQLLVVETLLMELGSNLVPLALAEQGGDLKDRVAGARRTIAMDMGIVLPTIRIRDNMQLSANKYVFKLRDQVVAEYELMRNHILAIESGMLLNKIDGLATKEPAYGGDAIWIPKSMREQASMAGYVLADPASVLITHLTEVMKQHAHELLTRQEVQGLLDSVKETNKVLVDELIPGLMTLGEVQKVLQNLLRERVSIRDLVTVLETLADWSPRTKDIDQLTEYVRAALARQICRQHADDDGVVQVMTLDQNVEQKLRESVQMSSAGVTLTLEPRIATAVLSAISNEADRVSRQGYSPILLCSSQVRLAVKRFAERHVPTLTVLAYSEMPAGVEVRAVGTVSANMATTPLREFAAA